MEVTQKKKKKKLIYCNVCICRVKKPKTPPGLELTACVLIKLQPKCFLLCAISSETHSMLNIYSFRANLVWWTVRTRLRTAAACILQQRRLSGRKQSRWQRAEPGRTKRSPAECSPANKQTTGHAPDTQNPLTFKSCDYI